MEINGETKSGVSTISLGRLQCIRRYSAGPTDRKRRRRRRRRLYLYTYASSMQCKYAKQ
jgi:hypothetical protein